MGPAGASPLSLEPTMTLQAITVIPMRLLLLAVLLAGLMPSAAWSQQDLHGHHHHPGMELAPSPASAPVPHSPSHDLGPAGSTYDLRWLDAMVLHHTGALRMGEVVFDIGAPGLGALAKGMWSDQAREIKAMGQWRRAWYPEAPVHPVVLRAGGNPDAIEDLIPMGQEQNQAHRMMATKPTRTNRQIWFLEGMLEHHGGALQMAHDALQNSTNPTIRRLAREIILAQRHEILILRRMLQHDGLNKPEYFRFDSLFSL